MLSFREGEGFLVVPAATHHSEALAERKKVSLVEALCSQFLFDATVKPNGGRLMTLFSTRPR